MQLPELLAGPILRRCGPERVCVWVATSVDAHVSVTVYEMTGDGSVGAELGMAGAERVRLGDRLFVHLAEVRPSDGTFPLMSLLGYRLEVGDKGLSTLGLLQGKDSIAYDGLDVPTFYLGSGPDVRLLHGSCHMMHGTGDDALPLGDDVIAEAPTDLAVRPSSLFLTGDQIYADSVAGALLTHLTALGDELMGFEESSTIPGVPPLRDLGVYARSELCTSKAGLSSHDCDNHLMSFGEFTAMYLLTYNRHLWPESLPGVSDVLSHSYRDPKKHLKCAQELKELKRVLPTLHQVRRLLANVPTYMMFDDHDVTDDWNLTQEWSTRVHESLTGRRIISNALAAAWAFQMWGNDPDAFPRLFKDLVSAHLCGGHDPLEGFDDAMWNFDTWSFFAPTNPPVIVLDTRTHRQFDGWKEPAQLIGDNELKRVVSLVERSGFQPGGSLLMVSPVPVYELPLWEGPQKYIAYAIGPYGIDLEAWRSNLNGFVTFMETILGLHPGSVVFFSGDLHYGFSMNATFSDATREVQVVQLTSSGTKNSVWFTRYVVRPLALMLHKSDTRLGWKGQPSFGRSPVRRRWLTFREEKIEGGNLQGPTWLSPKRAAALDPDSPNDYVETRTYTRVSHVVASPVLGKNNLGLVSIRDGGVMHELLVHDDGSRERFSAVLQSHPVGEGG